MNTKVKILGTGSSKTDQVITNFDLEKMVDTTDEWITTRTGIKERRIAKEGGEHFYLCFACCSKSSSRCSASPRRVRPYNSGYRHWPDMLFSCYCLPAAERVKGFSRQPVLI